MHLRLTYELASSYFVLLMKSHLQSYPSPLQINSFWNLGFLLGITIILQIITGIFLGLHYTSDLLSAYSSLFFFIREIYYGWCLRYLHSSGASFVFLFLFLHLGRAISYGRKYFSHEPDHKSRQKTKMIDHKSLRVLMSIGNIFSFIILMFGFYFDFYFLMKRKEEDIGRELQRIEITNESQRMNLKELDIGMRFQTNSPLQAVRNPIKG